MTVVTQCAGDVADRYDLQQLPRLDAGNGDFDILGLRALVRLHCRIEAATADVVVELHCRAGTDAGRRQQRERGRRDESAILVDDDEGIGLGARGRELHACTVDVHVA